MDIPKRRLGRTGEDVAILGLGGEGILRTVGYDRDASRLINRAIDLGITYFESARAYDGSEAYYGRALKERRKDIFLTSKSHARTKEGALYTYDWGNPAPPHYGVSEFVINSGTAGVGVFIKSCTWTGAYFNN